MEENEIEEDIVEDVEVVEDVIVEETEDESDQESDSENDAEDIDWKARAIKAETLIEAKKREAKQQKKVEPTSETKTEQDLTTKDVLALVRNNVSEDDMDEVIEYAKFKNIPIADAIKTPAVKAILAEKAENRSVAEASNTGTARRGSSKISDEALLSNASKGQLPESDEDLRRLIRLRRGIK
jgi:hypothetical protein